ncbi:hypothetical protein LSTR_LSTR010464 [Laodelphax striatellus]|uniref:Reverse transcriptase domain-containing protein n=1 Tax=Laodelphax striatellus TaxID=195883 RepID=A0A482X6H9_LAOST|nr:hypothetical protein LSTR_LSTR010464 [Laodelphax striatellus]
MLDMGGKLLERLLKPLLNQAIDRAGGLSEKQHGFRKGHSTVEYNVGGLRAPICYPWIPLNILKDYLRDRRLVYETEEGWEEKIITAGAAQGSILGPDLWNVAYNSLLQEVMPTGARLIAYADDVAAVISGRSLEMTQLTLNQVMRREKSAHTCANDIGMRKCTPIPQLSTWSYLGYKTYILATYPKGMQESSKGYSSTKCTHGKCGGPKPRRGALRIASAYRTVSEAAALVVAGVTPIDLLVLERKSIFDHSGELGES